MPFYPSPHRIVTKNRKSTLALQLSHRPYLNPANIFTNILFLFQDLIWNPALRLVIISRQSPLVCNSSSFFLRMRLCIVGRNVTVTMLHPFQSIRSGCQCHVPGGVFLSHVVNLVSAGLPYRKLLSLSQVESFSCFKPPLPARACPF